MERISLTIPKRFKKHFDNAMKDISNDPEFKRGIKDRMKKDKRINQYKQKAVKIRYAIAYYVNSKIIERRKITRQSLFLICNLDTDSLIAPLSG